MIERSYGISGLCPTPIICQEANSLLAIPEGQVLGDKFADISETSELIGNTTSIHTTDCAVLFGNQCPRSEDNLLRLEVMGIVAQTDFFESLEANYKDREGIEK